MKELNFKPSAILPDRYLVSECGKVLSLATYTIKQLYPNEKGYIWVRFRIDGIIKNIKLHRLVALTWIPNPHNFPEINHKDCDKTNNHVSNLEWCTRKWNMEHAVKNQRMNNRNTTKIIQMDLAGNILKEWQSVMSAAEHLQCHQSGIVKTITQPHIRKSYKGFKWKYA